MDSINITYTYNKDDFKCAICLEYLNNKIFQCTMGPHYVCNKCNTNLKFCPVCRNKKLLVRAIYLEQELKKFLINCNNHKNGCNEMIFKWDDNHLLVCKYRPYKCLICSKEIDNLIMHLMDGLCNIQFDKTKFTMNKPKFKCTLKTENSPTLIEIINRYIILIYPENQNYKIVIISQNDNLLNKKINCKISSNNIEHIIILPIINYHDFCKNYGLISFPVNNSIFIFEDPNFLI